MYLLSDTTLIIVTNDINKRITRPKYEEMLVHLGICSLDILNDEWEYRRLSKRDLIIETLKSADRKSLLTALLDRLRKEHVLRDESLRALAMDGIEFEHSLAGSLADPIAERSKLELALERLGLQQVQSYLNQSLENYSQGTFEAANAMSRTALEHLTEQIARRISALRNNEAIPQRGTHIGPVDYRNYLRQTSFLDNSEKEFLDKFYGYASTNGSHPGISSEAEARLRRFVVIGISLLFLEKLENAVFMKSLI